VGVAEAEEAAITNNDVIHNRYAHNRTSGNESAREGYIVR
jgi:hypothetical protein